MREKSRKREVLTLAEDSTLRSFMRMEINSYEVEQYEDDVYYDDFDEQAYSKSKSEPQNEKGFAARISAFLKTFYD